MASACSGPSDQPVEIVTVEGEVTARGQEPFAEYVLETEGGSLYVINFGGEPIQTPARLRVTGRLYTALWDGRPFAHVEAAEWERSP